MTGPAYGQFGNEDDVAIVRAVYDAFARRDVDGMLSRVSPDVEFYPQGTVELTGREEPYRGHDGIRRYFEDARGLWDELFLHPEDVRAAAGGVVVFGWVEGRTGDEVVRRQVVWSWKLRDGLAVSVRATDLGPAPR
jgi:ketosteroid isomerase-like protein